MAYTVFFRENEEIYPTATYLSGQLPEHQDQLQTLADTLSIHGNLEHPFVSKNKNGDWWVMLKANNGDVYNYSIFISGFEQDETKSESPTTQKALVIIDPQGPKDSVGGYHPGYWTIAQYASLLEESQRVLFMSTIYKIEHNLPSDYYSVANDNTILIQIS